MLVTQSVNNASSHNFMILTYQHAFILGPLTPLVDLNVLGDTSDYDEKRCMLINSWSGVSGRAVVGLTNRHYVKAVGINTRNDEMSS